MIRKVPAVVLAMAALMPPTHAEEVKCTIEQSVCDANNRAFACYVEYSRKLDDGISDVRVIARPIRHACDGMIEYAIARRWHATLRGDPNAVGIDEKWKIASAEFLRNEGLVLHKDWYDDEMDKILSVILQLRALRFKR